MSFFGDPQDRRLIDLRQMSDRFCLQDGISTSLDCMKPFTEAENLAFLFLMKTNLQGTYFEVMQRVSKTTSQIPKQKIREYMEFNFGNVFL